MKKRLSYLVLAALSGGVLLALTLFWMGAASPAQANPGIRYVAPPPTGNDGGGNDCTNSSSPCATIQHAVDVSIAEDEIRVAQGTYYKPITLTRSVMLEGGWNADFTVQDGDTYVTTIDAQRAGSVIRVEDTVSPTIEGFIITGGDATSALGWGGGIVVYYSGPEHGGLTTIRHNVITDNIACQSKTCLGEGGGIMVYASDAIIEHNTIISNVARTGGDGGGKGGGISIGWSSDATIADNTILSNTAVYSPTGLWEGQGGGVYMGGSSVTLIGNEIRGNVATVLGTGRGGGVYGEDELYENQILSNTASISGTGYGGGVYAYSVFQFHNNLVQGNVASRYGEGTGGGIYANQLQRAYHDTIVDNTATRGGGLYLGQWSNTEMRGCLITDNSATGDTTIYDGGGGIASVDDDLRLTDNRIISNTTAGNGGGLLITDSSNYLLQANTIVSNTSVYGGGIYVYSSTGTIADNWILNNTAKMIGGGIDVADAATAIESNHILGNQALEGSGVGIFSVSRPVTLTNQVIAHNRTEPTIYGYGLAGVYVYDSTAVRLINNTLVNDRTSAPQEGVALEYNSRVTMTNNIVVGHHVAVTVEAGSTAVLSHNDYWDNDIGVAGQISGTTDMTLDPLFEDRAAGDYHLALTSLLIDAGENTVNVDYDFEGDPRPRGGGIDVGADEAYRAESYVSEAIGSDTTGNGSPGAPFATVTKAISETRTGGTVHVGRGSYTENITLTHSVDLLGGYNEADWSRDIGSYTTTLDGGGAGTVVLVQQDVQALVEGFTITGGDAGSLRDGGGILIDQGAATIRYNRITDNHAGNAGGGLAIYGNEWTESVVEANRVYGNTADGIGFESGSPGGGMLVFDGPARVINNFVYSNTSAAGGDGMALLGSSAPVQAHHNTVVDNGGTGGVGIELMGASPEAVLYNNLIVGHGTGISTTTTTQATWDYNGFHDNLSPYAPSLTGGAHDQNGDPLFIDRGAGDYHLNPGSPMINQGMEAGVSTDIDGDPRPIGPAPDIGADEQGRYVYLPLILRNYK